MMAMSLLPKVSLTGLIYYYLVWRVDLFVDPKIIQFAHWKNILIEN